MKVTVLTRKGPLDLSGRRRSARVVERDASPRLGRSLPWRLRPYAQQYGKLRSAATAGTPPRSSALPLAWPPVGVGAELSARQTPQRPGGVGGSYPKGPAPGQKRERIATGERRAGPPEGGGGGGAGGGRAACPERMAWRAAQPRYDPAEADPRRPGVLRGTKSIKRLRPLVPPLRGSAAATHWRFGDAGLDAGA